MRRFAGIPLLFLIVACAPAPPAPPASPAPAAPPAAASAPAPAPAPPPAAAPASDAATQAHFRLPGDYAERTTLAELQKRFGPHEVRVQEAPQDDGTVRRSVILFPDDPQRRAYVEFHDSDALAGIASISVRDAGSVWRGKGGVHVGMSVADLRRANGGPFYFSGFDELGRGWVRDQWSPAIGDEARLGALDVEEPDHMYFGVDIGLRGGPGAMPADAWPHDESVLSDDPRWPRLGEIAEVTAIVASTSLDDEWE